MGTVINRFVGISIGTGMLSIASLGLGTLMPAQAANFTMNATWSGAEFGNTASATATIVMNGDFIDITRPISYDDSLAPGVVSMTMTVTDGNGIIQTFSKADFSSFTFDSANTVLNFTKNLVGQDLSSPFTGKTWNITNPIVTDPNATDPNATDPNFMRLQKDENGDPLLDENGNPIYIRQLTPYVVSNTATSSYAGDFNFFKVDPPGICRNFPSGIHRFIMASCFDDSEDVKWMRLTSLTLQSVKPVPVPGVLFGAIAAGAYFSARTLRKKKSTALASVEA
ncbi:hypothetical protein TUMEXPCC7403_11165 [Tumidithrix helvetica PCC 7403]|uniref:hypothetical protein n=1 Tax=Tumidithrix helvetica TaxID=3457545 RepID=UPI003C95B7B9